MEIIEEKMRILIKMLEIIEHDKPYSQILYKLLDEKSGRGIKTPSQLVRRMKILVGSMIAGNNSPVLKNELSQINNNLLKIGAIDNVLHEKLHQKYLTD